MALRPTTPSYLSFDRIAGGIDALDGLRALAVLLVLLRHAAFPVAVASGGPVWAFGGYELITPFLNGWAGVDLFFVLSGFLIGGHLLRKDCGTFRWRDYLTQRALRIVPTYWFVLAIVLAGAIPYYTVDDHHIALRAAYHILFLQDYLPPNIVVAFWSLGVEEKFYLLAPVLVFGSAWIPDTRRRMALLVGVCLLAVLSRGLLALRDPGPITYVDFVATYRFPFHHCIDTLVIGVIAAMLHRDLKASGKSHAHLGSVLAWSGFMAIGWLLCSTELLGVIDWWDKTWQPDLIGAAFGVMVLGCALGGGPRRLLSCAALRVAARLSYPLYLIHMTLIPLCWHLIGAEPAGSGSALIAFIPVFFAVSFLAAAAIHFGVEKPFLLLKDKLKEQSQSSLHALRHDGIVAP
jgi:peptidoglycan/LPS O-acetylase OafA/YrhL